MAESNANFKARLQEAGRWDDFVARRESMKLKGKGSAADVKKLKEAYSDDISNVINGAGDGTAAKGKAPKELLDPKDEFADKLPNGMPLVNSDIWKVKAKTTTSDDFSWVNKCLGAKTVKESDAPSLAAWRMYYDARYSIVGFNTFRANYKTYTAPTQKSLLESQQRDDNGPISALFDNLLDALDKRESNG